MKISDAIWTPNPFPALTGRSEKLSVTGANEAQCRLIHAKLCRLSPIADLAEHNAVLAQLLPDNVSLIFKAMSHPSVQSGDVRGIMAMRAHLPAPEAAIPEVKPSPVGLGCVPDMDHRLGAWK